MIYFLEAEIPFPDSKEKVGCFVGIVENVGDELTFWRLTEDTEALQGVLSELQKIQRQSINDMISLNHQYRSLTKLLWK